MSDQPKASGIPTYTDYSDYDVFNGKDGLDKKEATLSTFHTSDMEEGDAAFKLKAELMEGSGAEILGQEEKLETEAEKEKEMATSKQSKEAAL